MQVKKKYVQSGDVRGVGVSLIFHERLMLHDYLLLYDLNNICREAGGGGLI